MATRGKNYTLMCLFCYNKASFTWAAGGSRRRVKTSSCATVLLPVPSTYPKEKHQNVYSMSCSVGSTTAKCNPSKWVVLHCNHNAIVCKVSGCGAVVIIFKG